MKVSEAFLVNTKNFDPIIKTLVNYDAEDIVVNSDLLEHLSYSDPNDLLVIRILKDFAILDNDGKPDKLFEEFQNPKTTKRALAKGLLSAYEGIFDQHPKIHQRPPEKIKEVFEDYFKDKKTDLIIKYISGTFEKVVSYVGGSTIDAVLKDNADEENVTEAVAETAEQNFTNNGSQLNGNNNRDVKREEISDNNIDDFLNSFEKSDSNNDFFNTPDNPPQGTSNQSQSKGSSIHEFMNNLEESERESMESTEDNTNKSTSEELYDALDDIEETNTRSTEHSNKNASPAYKTETNSQYPGEVSIPTEPAREKQKGDIASNNLESPTPIAPDSTYSEKNIPAEHKFIQKALLRKSDLLHKMKRWGELVPTLEEIIDRYDNQDNIDFRNAVDRAIIRRAIALLKLGKHEDALPALNSVISRFKNSDNKEFYEQASRAMLFKVNILERTDATSDELLPLYNSIIDRLDANSELLMKEKLDEIHCKRFDLIAGKNNPTMLLEACTKLFNRFKDSNNHIEYLQKAMIIRAEMLDEMGEDEAALQAYDAFLNKFGNG
jgi:tetratricopeptide (TPR) repeat protein